MFLSYCQQSASILSLELRIETRILVVLIIIINNNNNNKKKVTDNNRLLPINRYFTMMVPCNLYYNNNDGVLKKSCINSINTILYSKKC